jgi:hypothetical protein
MTNTPDLEPAWCVWNNTAGMLASGPYLTKEEAMAWADKWRRLWTAGQYEVRRDPDFRMGDLKPHGAPSTLNPHPKLQEFRGDYVAAALFSACPEDETWTWEMISSTLHKAITADCEVFLTHYAARIASAEHTHKPGSPTDTVWEHAGRDFWYTREGHGCGFWDGDWPQEIGDMLAKGARLFGPANWYVNPDDGKLYQEPAELPVAQLAAPAS